MWRRSTTTAPSTWLPCGTASSTSRRRSGRSASRRRSATPSGTRRSPRSSRRATPTRSAGASSWWAGLSGCPTTTGRWPSVAACSSVTSASGPTRWCPSSSGPGPSAPASSSTSTALSPGTIASSRVVTEPHAWHGGTGVASAPMGEIVEFQSNGSIAEGYLAVPESGTGIPVVVIQEWWGLVPHIEDVCDRFAAEGFVALAPDLFHGQTTTEPDEAGKLMMSLNIDQAATEMSGAVDKVAEVAGSDRVGVTGFCIGGGLALVLAARRPDKVKAVGPWYGLIPWPGAEPDWSTLDAKVLGHYAGDDAYFTPELAE